MPVEVAAGLRAFGFCAPAVGFAAAVHEAIGGSLMLITLPQGLFSRFAKVDDVAQFPALDGSRVYVVMRVRG